MVKCGDKLYFSPICSFFDLSFNLMDDILSLVKKMEMIFVAESRIRQIRKQRKLSGTTVAKQLGISAQHYYDIEKGENGLSAENALKLAELFEFPLQYILGQSALAQIEDKLAELGMSKDELCQLTDTPRMLLDNLDHAVLGPWDFDDGETLSDIAEVLNMDKEKLFAAHRMYARVDSSFAEGAMQREDEKYNHRSEAPNSAATNDKLDLKRMLEEDAPVMFDGVPISEEDREKIKRVMEAMFWDAKKKAD